jgi:hypothetical protein
MTASQTFSHLHHVQPSAARVNADPVLGMLHATGYAVAVAPLNGVHVSGMRIHIAHRDTGRALTWGAFRHTMQRAGFDPLRVVADSIGALAESVNARSWWRSCVVAYLRTEALCFHADDSETQRARDLDRLAQLTALCLYRPGSARGQIGTLTRGDGPACLSFLASAHGAR